MPKYIFNPLEAEFDAIEDRFGTEGIYLTDSNGVEWQVTVNTAGALVTTAVVPPAAGGELLYVFGLGIPITSAS